MLMTYKTDSKEVTVKRNEEVTEIKSCVKL